jgi:hypothetical protein
MASDHGKQPCECGHGRAIHRATRLRLKKKFHTPCRFPGCDCCDYKPKEKRIKAFISAIERAD